MKMTSEDFRQFNEALLFVVDLTKNHVSDVDTYSYAWQILWAASEYRKVNIHELYKYLNDENIETAMRHVFPNLKRR
jgi:predicted RNA binding protein with dsRBD fold (UPF0201 family)